MLNDLKNSQNPKKNRKRVGRGIGSGKGKTCGSGHKGQKSRSGVSINGFEGGQMPIYRRVPKRGFSNKLFRLSYQWVNLSDIQKAIDLQRIDPSKVINGKVLYEVGLVRKISEPVKILAKGLVNVPIEIDVNSASKTAIDLIEKAGGKVSFSG